MTLGIANIEAQLRDLANQDVWSLAGSTAPTNGTSGTGAGLAGPGSDYTRTSNGVKYVNTNTKASPTWTLATNSSLGANVGTFLATPSSANLAAALTDETGTGLAVFGTNPTLVLNVATPAAAGSIQGDATAIVVASPALLGVTAADGTKGVKLPAATAGAAYFVKNNAAAILKVYPNTGDTINAIAANTAISMGSLTSAVYICVTAGSWFTIPLLPS